MNYAHFLLNSIYVEIRLVTSKDKKKQQQQTVNLALFSNKKQK